jgi:hypothetical protein
MSLFRSVLVQSLKQLVVKRFRRERRAVGHTEIPVAVRPISGLQLAPRRAVRRHALLARVSAALAVHANVPKGAFLKTQHAIYRATAPRDVTAPIPETEIDQAGEFRIIPLADVRHPSDIFDVSEDIASLPGPVAAEAAFQRNASQAAGLVVARQLEEREGDLRTIERRARDLDEQLERGEIQRNDAAVARARSVEDGSTEGEPPTRVPSLALILSWRLFEIATMAGESVTCLAALANSGGLDPTNLTVEWRSGAAPSIIGWAVAAVTISALLFVICEWSFARIGAAIANGDDPQRRFQLITGSAALVFVTLVVSGISFLRAQLGGAGQVSVGLACIYFIVGATPLVGGSLVHIHADALSAKRDEALKKVSTPNPAAIAVRLRAEHEQALARERDLLRARRDALTAGIQLLHAQMHGAEQAVRDIARHETRVVQEWLDSLGAALAKDAKYYEYYARKWDRPALLASMQVIETAGTLVPIRKRRLS